MHKFSQIDVADALGFTPICQISDEEIWQNVVSPIVQGLLGKIVRVDKPRVLDTVTGLFPGDEVTNLNDHRLFGGQTGYVRFPYLHTLYRTQNGAFVVKRDGLKFEAICWYGDFEKGRAEMILKVALRDRRYDGTRRANDSALLEYAYDDATINSPIDSQLKSVELSIYGFMPGSRVSESDGDLEFEKFIKNPYTFLDRPELFLKYFERAWKGRRAPGQSSAPIKDVSELVLAGFERLARKTGYDLIEAAPSHFHVAKWILDNGYKFSRPEEEKMFRRFQEGLEKIRAAGTPLTRQQQSWICVVQSLKPELIPAGLNLDGPIWPQDNISQYCLWMYKTISERAKDFVPPAPVVTTPATGSSEVAPAATADATTTTS